MEKNQSDPNIEVSITGPEHHHCILIKFGSHNVYLHARSAIDLQNKLGLTITDWFSKTALSVLRSLKD